MQRDVTAFQEALWDCSRVSALAGPGTWTFYKRRSKNWTASWKSLQQTQKSSNRHITGLKEVQKQQRFLQSARYTTAFRESRSEERRGGKECVSTGRLRWARDH